MEYIDESGKAELQKLVALRIALHELRNRGFVTLVTDEGVEVSLNDFEKSIDEEANKLL